MKKIGIVFVLVCIGLGIACFPAYSIAKDAKHGEVITTKNWLLSNVRVKEAPKALWSGPLKTWDYAYDVRTTYTQYRTACGSLLHPARPTARIIGRSSHVNHVDSVAQRKADQFEGNPYGPSDDVHSAAQALEAAQHSYRQYPLSSPRRIAHTYGQDCIDKRNGTKLGVFLASPVGWIVIAFGLLLGLALAAGGGGDISGSVVPGIFDGQFSIRLWK